MGLFGKIASALGSGAGKGVSEVLEGAGKAAVNIRSAITGDIPPEKAAELEAAAMELEARLAEAAQKVNEAEAKSGSLFIAGWRPAIGWICAIALLNNYVVVPYVTAFTTMKFPELDLQAILGLTISMLGMASLRTGEKFRGVNR